VNKVNPELRNNFPPGGAAYLAHRYADLEEAKPRSHDLIKAGARLEGACNVLAAMGVATTGASIRTVVMDAWNTVGPRPRGYGVSAEFLRWSDEMTAAIVAAMKDVI
jgi:hypothetical protein